ASSRRPASAHTDPPRPPAPGPRCAMSLPTATHTHTRAHKHTHTRARTRTRTRTHTHTHTPTHTTHTHTHTHVNTHVQRCNRISSALQVMSADSPAEQAENTNDPSWPGLHADSAPHYHHYSAHASS